MKNYLPEIDTIKLSIQKYIFYSWLIGMHFKILKLERTIICRLSIQSSRGEPK